MKKIKIDFSFIWSGIFIILFMIWTIFVLKGTFLTFDYQVFAFVHHYLLSDILTFFLKMITYMGISLGFNLFLVSMLNLILKNIFLIPRPDTLTLILEKGFSYPSGHAMASLAFYGFLIYLVYKKMKTSAWKKVLILLLILLILLIGFSRIYLGVHHFSDIIGGYLISLAYFILFIKLIQKLGMEKVYEVQKRN